MRGIRGSGLAIDDQGGLIEVTRPYKISLKRWVESNAKLVSENLIGGKLILDITVSARDLGRAKTPAFADGPFDALDAVCSCPEPAGYGYGVGYPAGRDPQGGDCCSWKTPRDSGEFQIWLSDWIAPLDHPAYLDTAGAGSGRQGWQPGHRRARKGRVARRRRGAAEPHRTASQVHGLDGRREDPGLLAGVHGSVREGHAHRLQARAAGTIPAR